jgi:hypothetical protein
MGDFLSGCQHIIDPTLMFQLVFSYLLIDNDMLLKFSLWKLNKNFEIYRYTKDFMGIIH